MAYATWLADVLRAAGCTVIEEGDWKSRSAGSTFTPKAVMLHHDASAPGPSPGVVDILINGRTDLSGPLSQLWLDYYGKWHIIAAGRCNHAGTGGPWGVIPVDSGNTYAIGIESDHTTGELWTPAQETEALKGISALCDYMGIDPNNALLGHKEWAPTRKVDPDPVDMDYVRRLVKDYTGGDWFDMATQADLENAVRKVLNEGAGKGTDGTWASTNKSILSGVQNNYNQINEVQTEVRNVLNEGAGQGTDGTWKTTNKNLYDRTGSIINMLNDVLDLLQEEVPPTEDQLGSPTVTPTS